MTKKLKLKKADFYITNVCNFNCDDCNKFNNINFSGKQNWLDYKTIYANWANIIDIDKFAILGGEPMTSPDYMEWVEGIAELWPTASGELVTNGYYLKSSNRTLYNLFKKFNNRLTLEIGLHNKNRATEVLNTVRQWLVGEVVVKRFPENLRDLPGFDDNWNNSYNQIKGSTWPECATIDHWNNLPHSIRNECITLHNFSPEILAETRKSWLLHDSNGVKVSINYENYFSNGSLNFSSTPTVTAIPYQSNPVISHSNCSFANEKCYTFIKGNLYKCSTVALLPEIDKKFGVSVSSDDKKLLYSYTPAKCTMSIDEIQKFINELDRPIDQCKFCPENYSFKEIFSEHKKKKIFLKPIKNNMLSL